MIDTLPAVEIQKGFVVGLLFGEAVNAGQSEPSTGPCVGLALAGGLLCEGRQLVKHPLASGAVFCCCLVLRDGGRKAGDQAGVVCDKPEGVGEGEKVPENGCASGVFGGRFIG